MKRLPPQPLYAVPESVLDLARRFQYPDMDTVTPLAQPSGGGGTPTVVVAAANATDISKSKADYICSGANDQTTVLEAISVIEATGVGGRLLLTEGQFNFVAANDTIIQSNQAGLTIEGMGPEATTIVVTGVFGAGDGVFDCSAADVQIRQLRLEENTNDASAHFGIITGGDRSRVIDVDGWVTGSASVFLQLDGSLSMARGLNIEEGTVGIRSSAQFGSISECNIFTHDTGVTLDSTSTSMRVVNNHINGFSKAIEIIDSDDIVIVGNKLDAVSPVDVTNSDTLVMAGNVMDCSGAAIIGTGTNWQITGNIITGGTWGVDNQGDAEWLIADNIFIGTFGCRFDVGANNCLVAGNTFDSGGQILFDGGSFNGCKVTGNTVVSGQGDAVDGIIVFDNGAVDCQITDNQIYDANAEDAIRVTGATDVMISGNQIGEGADKGIVVSSGVRCQVVANSVKFSGEHGIDYGGADGELVGNLVYGSGQNTTNTWDNIIVAGNANLVEANHVLPAPSAPVTRYGINIASGSNNAVYANALGDSSVYGTADSIDSGTATQTTPAAGAIGGQFTY